MSPAIILILKADARNNQGESEETNNLQSLPLTIAAADLTVTAVQAPATAALNQTVPMSWTVTNQGTIKAPAVWSDRIYLSSDGQWDASDLLLGTFRTTVAGTLDPAASVAMSQMIAIPLVAETGSRYLLFIADGTGDLGEADEANNLRSAPITITAPDLLVTQLTAPTAASWGQTIRVEWTVANQGQGTATVPWVDSVYFSKDDRFDAADVYLNQAYADANLPFAANATYSFNREVVIPNGATGLNYLLVVADASHSQPESNEANNVRASAIELSAADLVVTAVTAPASVSLGQTINLTWTVLNQGTGLAASGWYDNVYLSSDDQWDAHDSVLLNAWIPSIPTLAAGASYTLTRPITIPATATGNQYLLIKTNANGNQGESSNANNVKAHLITVSAADLSLQASAPTAIRLGQEMTVNWTVTNTGGGNATGSWSDYVYLSDNATYESSDRYLTSEWANRTAAANARRQLHRQPHACSLQCGARPLLPVDRCRRLAFPA